MQIICQQHIAKRELVIGYATGNARENEPFRIEFFYHIPCYGMGAVMALMDGFDDCDAAFNITLSFKEAIFVELFAAGHWFPGRKP